MRPPLVAHLVRHDVIDHVDVVGVIQVGNESDRLRIWHGAGIGLRKRANPGEFNDPRFFVIIGTEILRVVLQRLLQRFHHPRHVPRMILVVVHLEFDAIPFFALHLVAGRHKRVEA